MSKLNFKHISIILRAGIYICMTTFIVSAAAFHEAGAQAIKLFTWADWLVLFVTIGASVFTNLNAYFDRSFSSHLDDLKAEKGDTTVITKP